MVGGSIEAQVSGSGANTTKGATPMKFCEIRVSDDLYELLRRSAAVESETVDEFVDTILRALLDQRLRTEMRGRQSLH